MDIGQRGQWLGMDGGQWVGMDKSEWLEMDGMTEVIRWGYMKVNVNVKRTTMTTAVTYCYIQSCIGKRETHRETFV